VIFFINSFILSIACFYVSGRFLKLSINYKRAKYWLIIILNSVLIIASFICTTHFLKVVFNYVVLVILNKIYFEQKLIDTIMASFFVFVLIAIGEILSAIVLVTLLGFDPLKMYVGQFWINLFVSVFMVSIINYKKTISFFFIISERGKHKIIKEILPLVIIIVFIYPAYFYYLYFESNLLNTMVLSITLIVIINVLVISILRERSYSANLKTEYDELINNLNEYEKVLEKYRLANHENKNNFIVLKGLLKDDKDNVVEYIDEIINNKQVDDEEVLIKTKKLPMGGLQGLVYQKLLVMKEKLIVYNIEISRDVDVTLFSGFDFTLIKNFCTIIGILIDNSIEAVENLDNKMIGIYIYKENDTFVFSIANTFFGIIDLDKIDKIGYSSKGKGRGYGLNLAKKIVEKDKRIVIEREIVRDVFKQKVKIKM